MKAVTIISKTDKGQEALSQALAEEQREVLGVRFMFNRMYIKKIISKKPLTIQIIGKAPAVRVFVKDEDMEYKIEATMKENNGSLKNVDYSLEFEK